MGCQPDSYCGTSGKSSCLGGSLHGGFTRGGRSRPGASAPRNIHEHREAQADAKAYSQNYEWFKMPENEEQEVRGESLWPEMRWKCRQKPNHGRSLSSGIQATSKSSSSVPRVWLYLRGAKWLPELQPLHTFIHLHIYTGTVSSDGSSHTRPESWLWLELPAGLLATLVRVSLHYFVGQSLIPD